MEATIYFQRREGNFASEYFILFVYLFYVFVLYASGCLIEVKTD